MKVFYDTEFIDDGKTIDLISIGLVREDGAELYLENIDVDWTKADPWVLEHVKKQLGPAGERVGRAAIAQQVREFVGPNPEFWAYYASYDWVVLCQLYGRMLDVPKGWPHMCRDLKQLMLDVAPNTTWKSPRDEHHALADARWVRNVYNAVMIIKASK